MANVHTAYYEHPDIIPGIQPIGFLFLLDTEGKIVHVSENINEFLDSPAERFINKNITDILDRETSERLSFFLKDHSVFQKTFFPVVFKDFPYSSWLGSIYKHKEGYVFELEKSNDDKVDFTYFENILDTSIYLSSSETLQDIFAAAVKIAQEVTGYDEIIFFKYNETNLGEIVAQNGSPREAEENIYYYDYLFTLSPFRFYNSLIYLPDLSFKHRGLYPAIGNKAEFIAAGQLWATNSSFLKFLKSFNAGAFIGINIVINKNIWGRIACFNSSKKEISPFARQKLIFLGQLISSTIAMKLMEKSNYREATFQILQAKLSEAMSSSSNFIKGLRTSTDDLLDLGNASGVAWKLDGAVESFGKSPSNDTIEKIAELCWHILQQENKVVFYSDSLGREDSTFKPIKNIASGILFLPISLQEKQFMIWFRPEKLKYILQLGETAASTNGQFVEEKIEGYSLPWNKEDIDNSFKFKNNLTNYIIQNSVRLKSSNDRLEKLVKERTRVLERENQKRVKAEKLMQKSLEELRRSNGELENFAYVASHDLQEPLRKIQAFSDRLKMLTKNKLDEKSEDYFNRMTAAAKRMQKLINDLLSFSRVTTHSKPFAVIDLNEMFANVVSDLYVKIEEKEATIQIDHFDHPVEGDDNQLHRVFQNLIQNALKFNRPGTPPHVHVKSKLLGKKYEISVKDNGIGFDEDYSKKIFQLFERLHGRSEYEGTGLGLAICKKIIERHNGTIKTKSKIGEGSEFIVELPLKQKAKL